MKKIISNITLAFLFLFVSGNLFSQVYTFTNCGATGRFGPTQAQVNATYTGPNPLTGNVTVNTQGIQEWVVPATGPYSIEVRGAKGQDSPTFQAGGPGITIRGDFNLVAGQVLKIAVGQIGEPTSDNEGAGGGGGSFVTDIANTPLIIAGGGGGGARTSGPTTPAVAGTTAQNGHWGGGGGTAGSGGNCGPCSSIGGGGGGGLLTNGSNGTPRPSTGGMSFVNGLVGGQNQGPIATGGGFGGGGGGANNCGYGGGGGGYSGGGPGGWNGGCGGSGGGGASFNSGTNQVVVGANNGTGQVIITLLCNPAIPPSISCPSNISVNNDAGNCSAVVTYTTPNDPCAVVTQTSGLPSGSAFPVGTTTNTFSATNAAGTVTCSFTVTVADAEAPVITCPVDATINTDAGQCTSTAAIGNASATDNCTASPVITNNAPASFPIGNTTVVWTATDGAGNTDTCHQVVTVVDAEMPTISCPSNITVSNDPNMCSAVVNYVTPTGTDNCSGAVTTLTSGLASGSPFPVGTTTVTYTVTDASNNVDSCSFTVTVIDSIAPTAVCQNFTAYLDATGMVNIIADSVDGGSTDDCLLDTLTLSQYTFTCADIGANTVTLYAADTYGNIDSCTATVTVSDSLAPIASCQDVTLYLDNSGNVTLIPDSLNNGSTDNCSIASYTASQTLFTCAEIGTNNVMLYVTDSTGNVDSCLSIVTVLDTIPPAIVCPNDQEVETDVTCIYEIGDYTSMASLTPDNCDMNNLMVTQIPSAGTMVTADNISNNSGQTIVTLIVQDMSGNVDSCQFVVDVKCSNELEIPNVFTPNGDGKNDLWNITGIDEYPDASVQVFSRWGDIVFEAASGYTDPWDGTYNGTDVPVATYYYIIKLDNTQEGISGTINVVR